MLAAQRTIEQQQVYQYLRWHLGVSSVSGLFYLGLGIVTQTLAGFLLSGATLLTMLVIIPSWRANRVGHAARAMLYMVAAFLIDASIVGILLPQLYPVVMLAPIIALATALPYMQGVAFRNVVIVSMTTLMLVTTIGVANVTVVAVALPTFVVSAILMSGTLFEAVLIGVLLWQHKQRIHQAMAALRDANLYLEQRVAERTQDLATAKRAAEQANALKTQFLANMSHELRTPLNAVIGMSALMSMVGPLTEQQQLFQARVRANGEHLLTLINDILDIAKIESGYMELACAPTDPLPLIESAMESCHGLLKDKPDVALVCAAAPPIPLVFLDAVRFRQILFNLLSNAAKFTDAGQITLQVTTDATHLHCTITDTGVGIAPDDHDLIFQEFRQASDGMGRSYGGTGLGLPITKRLVEMHGGTIWLRSTVGAGATFGFRIPLAQEETV